MPGTQKDAETSSEVSDPVKPSDAVTLSLGSVANFTLSEAKASDLLSPQSAFYRDLVFW